MVNDCVGCVGRKAALVALLEERNVWARQLADMRDERDAARVSAENLRTAVAWREGIILKVGALLDDKTVRGRGEDHSADRVREIVEGGRK